MRSPLFPQSHPHVHIHKHTQTYTHIHKHTHMYINIHYLGIISSTHCPPLCVGHHNSCTIGINCIVEGKGGPPITVGIIGTPGGSACLQKCSIFVKCSTKRVYIVGCVASNIWCVHCLQFTKHTYTHLNGSFSSCVFASSGRIIATSSESPS